MARRAFLTSLVLHLTASASSRCGNDETTANVVCAEFPRPRVAFVFAGAIRTFAQPVVYRTIKHNLIDAFGGDGTVFALLKKYDIRRDPRGDTIKPSAPEAVAAALGYIGAQSRNVAIQNATGAALGTCPGRQPYDSTARGQVASLAGQLDSRRRAYEMVVAEEGRTNIRFSHVLYTRPDLSWPMPMWPYCLGFDLGRAMRKHDWVWLLPREPDARLALRDLPASFFACERSGDAVERFMFAGYDCEESLARFSGVVTRQAHVNGEGVCKSLITDVPADGKGRWSLVTRPPRTLKQHFETCLKVTHRNSCANLDVKATHTRGVASTLPPLPPPPPPTYR